MTIDERNFRSAYYEKVGCRSVEEKKSLNILLKDKPLNRIKLKQFCLSFTVPTAQRSLLWNLLLGVLPVYLESREYVMLQRKAVYDDAVHALKVMRYVDARTSKSQIFYACWLLEQKKLHEKINILNESFLDIAEMLLQVFENDIEIYEIYWITKGFYDYALEIKNDIPKLKELSFTLLEKEDNMLYTHFAKHEILEKLPLEKWYASCFAGVLSEAALVRIWDKICGGSRKIVVFLFLALLKTLRLTLLRCTEMKQIENLIKEKKEEQDDLIVNKSIEFWQNNKNHTEFNIHRKDN